MTTPAPPRDLRRTARFAWSLAAVCVAAGLALLFCDLPLTRMLRGESLPGDIRKIVTVAEVFGHGAGVAFILLTLAVLAPGGWRWAVLPAVAAFGAGGLVNCIKLCVARTRPHAFASADIWESFQGWLPWWTVPEQAAEMGHAWQSFPSGHTATAAGLAWGLACYFPRGRWLFAFFAALAGLQRVHAGAHYPSDVLIGAAVGCFFAGVCLHPRLLGRRLVADSSEQPVDVRPDDAAQVQRPPLPSRRAA